MQNKGSSLMQTKMVSDNKTLQVVPYTVCEMGLEPQEAVSTELAPKLFVEKTCTQGKKEIPHTKMLPECKNVTKQNCVTLWETDADGKQVNHLQALIVNNRVRKVANQWLKFLSMPVCRCGLVRMPASQSPGRSVSWSPRMSSSLCRRSSVSRSRSCGTTSPRR